MDFERGNVGLLPSAEIPICMDSINDLVMHI